MRKFLANVATVSIAIATACLVPAGFLPAWVGPAIAGEYLLGPQDKVRLKIYEWRPSRDLIFEWTALNDEFVIGADGTIFLPFAGQIRAQGAAPGDLARSIGIRLMQQMGLGRAPDVAVEIVGFRPFYIVGQVTQSGEFPYRPGLTVLQALSIAGGLKMRDDTLARIERDAISDRGAVGLLALTNISLLARKARLEAELASKEEIVFPAELAARAKEGTIALMMQQEQLIFMARKDAMTTQLRALRELRTFLGKELSSLEKQLSFHGKQIALVQKELVGVSALVQKGLTTAPRELSLERTLAQMQSERLAAETSLLRVRQEMSKTDIAILELSNHHANEVAQTLRETQLQLDETARKASTASNLLYESQTSAIGLSASGRQLENIKPVYKIVRPSRDATGDGLSGSMEEFLVEETTKVEPGDTIKVELFLPPPEMVALPAPPLN